MGAATGEARPERAVAGTCKRSRFRRRARIPMVDGRPFQRRFGSAWRRGRHLRRRSHLDRNGTCRRTRMANALFAFDSLESARRAAERAAVRLPPEAVAVHTKDLGRSDSLFDQADETV